MPWGVLKQHPQRAVCGDNTAHHQSWQPAEDPSNPDEYHQATRLANKQMAWLVLTTEEANKYKEAGSTSLRFQSLLGSVRLPPAGTR